MGDRNGLNILLQRCLQQLTRFRVEHSGANQRTMHQQEPRATETAMRR